MCYLIILSILLLLYKEGSVIISDNRYPHPRFISNFHIHLCSPIFLGNGLFETLILPIQRKTSLLYAQPLYSSAQPIFETFIFVLTIQKPPSKPFISALIFVYLLQINSLTFRLKDVVSVERDAAICSEASGLLSLIGCPQRFCRIFYYYRAVFFADFLQFFQLSRCSVQVGHNNDFHIRIQLKCFFQSRRIHIPYR